MTLPPCRLKNVDALQKMCSRSGRHWIRNRPTYRDATSLGVRWTAKDDIHWLVWAYGKWQWRKDDNECRLHIANRSSLFQRLADSPSWFFPFREVNLLPKREHFLLKMSVESSFPVMLVERMRMTRREKTAPSTRNALISRNRPSWNKTLGLLQGNNRTIPGLVLNNYSSLFLKKNLAEGGGRDTRQSIIVPFADFHIPPHPLQVFKNGE